MALTVILDRSDAGKRLDRVLAARLPQISRSVLQRWLDNGQIKIDGKVATRKTKAEVGAKVEVTEAPPPPISTVAEALPIALLYEDAHILVVDKAAGMVVHPAPGHGRGTLVNALLHHSAPEGGEEPSRPGIVHRLDKDTSGVMVVAKSPNAHAALVAMFQAHTLDRAYVAIVVGHLSKEVKFDTTHARHPVHRKQFTSKSDKGKRAITLVKPLELMLGTSLIECRLQTGRTHQIRVHLSEARHPVLGDQTYGKSIGDPRVRAIASELGRQALHAKRLAFDHPIEGTPLEFESEPPQDFAQALSALRRLPER